MCPTVAWKTASVNSAPKRSHLTILNFQVSCPNYVPQCANTSKKSEHWPFGNWPGKGPVETKPENDKRERLQVLAGRIATEQDHNKFTQLVEELKVARDTTSPILFILAAFVRPRSAVNPGWLFRSVLGESPTARLDRVDAACDGRHR